MMTPGMLRFQLLSTPAADHAVLIEPPAGLWTHLLEEGLRRQGQADLRLAGIGVSEVRAEVRRRLGLPSDVPVLASGHQPELIHPGVWAKEVLAARAAAGLAAAGFNLIVDHDAPSCWSLLLPQIAADGLVSLRELPLGQAIAGSAYEGRPALSPSEIDRLVAAVGDQWADSLIHEYLAGLRACRNPRDWVEQHLSARRGVDRGLFEPLPVWRVGDVFGGAFVAELMLNAEAFARSYNAALAWYRCEQAVRSPRRPLPDLGIEAQRVETAFWIYRPGERRRRLWLEARPGGFGVLADGELVGVLEAGRLRREADVALGELAPWVVRPRALALTIWARLLACDLFIHGIGGAKYDRITDRIFEDYFRCPPPPYTCVSATLRLPLPADADARRRLADARRRLRDVEFNPQRYLGCPDAALLGRRAALIAEAGELRRRQGNPQERRRVWEELKAVNRLLLRQEPEITARLREQAETARRQAVSDRIASSREYFYALQARPRLDRLREALEAAMEGRGGEA